MDNRGTTSGASTSTSVIRTQAGRALLDLLHELSPGGHYSDRVAAVEGEAVAGAAALSGGRLRRIRAGLVEEVQVWVIGGHVDVGAAFDRACIRAATIEEEAMEFDAEGVLIERGVHL